MQKNKLFSLFSLLVLSITAHSQQVTLTKDMLEDFVKIESSKLLKDKCEINKKEISVQINNGKGLVIIPYESCGGGNNYGQLIYGFKPTTFIDKKNGEEIIGISKKSLPINNAQEINLTKTGFEILSAEYKPEDPKCCPSKIKKIDF